MLLELKNAQIRFLFDLGAGVKQLTTDLINKNFNDKNWHEITVKRFDRQRFSMKIDDFKELYVDIGSANPPLNELDSLIIGGILTENKLDKDILASEAFIGCLASIEINNEFSSSTLFKL